MCHKMNGHEINFIDAINLIYLFIYLFICIQYPYMQYVDYVLSYVNANFSYMCHSYLKINCIWKLQKTNSFQD
jgi:hypothetical protein